MDDLVFLVNYRPDNVTKMEELSTYFTIFVDMEDKHVKKHPPRLDPGTLRFAQILKYIGERAQKRYQRIREGATLEELKQEGLIR